ncbi:YybH family protein [Rheinheimera pacifica]|uniref:YybH family protein n=1 Tax=Rheinheimera pacifica TaxID=173990 RepID=UPI002ED83186
MTTKQVCQPAEAPLWQGEFSEQDKHNIEQLRAGQAAAIVAGDASAYAELCSDDIQLLIPSKELVSGKTAFLQVEQALFRSASFTGFEKQPALVVRSGDLAYEVGVQQVQIKNQADAAGVYAARQKYTHIFRRTSQGWRFAVLMSNPNE